MSLKWFIRIVVVVLVVQFLYFLGPQPSFNQDLVFEPGDIESDIATYLSTKEAKFNDIYTGAQKEVVWHGDPNQKTDISLVYIHGFSASRDEIDPVVEIVSNALKANVFYTRLRGHGRPGDAMAEATMKDWVNDTAEAVEIGKRIGEKVIVLSTSTGGTLATWAAAHPALSPDIAGVVLVSPNYAVQAGPTWQLTMPWGEYIIPLIGGEKRGSNCDIAEAEITPPPKWTQCYPTIAVIPMGAIMQTVEELDKSAIKTPALFIYSSEDMVVVPEAIETVYDAWGGPKDREIFGETSDSSNHVITGDARSPETTQAVSERIVNWISSL